MEKAQLRTYALNPLFVSETWTTEDFTSVLRVRAPEWDESTERRVGDRDLRITFSPAALMQDLASDAVSELHGRIETRLGLALLASARRSRNRRMTTRRHMVRCPSCAGSGKITLRQKAERRDGDADFLRPKRGEYWTVTIHRDGSVTESLRAR